MWLARVTVGIDDMAPCSKRRAHLDEPGHVRRLAGVDRVVEDVRVAAVEQEPDHVVGAAALVDQVGEHLAVLAAQQRVGAALPVQPDPVGVRAPPMSASTVGRHVDQPAGPGHPAERPHAGAGDDERRPGLHHAHRAVLAPLAAVVLPVVGGRVQDDSRARRWSKTWATIS